MLLSGSAIAIIGATMALSVGNNLFEAQREQVTATTVNATLAAQRVFDQAAEQLGPQDRDVTVFAAAEAIARAASRRLVRDPPRAGSVGRSPSAAGPGSSSSSDEIISDELRAAVTGSEEPKTFSQPVALEQDGAAAHPGIVVGSTLDIRGERYELYLVYDLVDAQQTLGFVQQTLAVGGLALVLLIGAVTYYVVRLVVGPVRLAAQTSERLAAGDLDGAHPGRGRGRHRDPRPLLQRHGRRACSTRSRGSRRSRRCSSASSPTSRTSCARR